MATAIFASRLRYLDADDVDDSVVDFDGLAVRGQDNEKLGDIDGFIVDVDSGRVLYVVVDSSGWFTSRRFLLPIGHATVVDRENGSLRVDLTRQALEKYPRFDEDRFQDLSNEELLTFEMTTAAACCADERVGAADVWPFDAPRHFAQPAWWTPGTYGSDRLRALAASAFEPVSSPARDRYERERIVAQARSDVTVGRDDVSPHFEGRAQPGDVLGIETGGERTSMGDTSEDENSRRRSAERAARRDEDDEPRRSER
jgi:PRC-barrel domain protein